MKNLDLGGNTAWVTGNCLGKFCLWNVDMVKVDFSFVFLKSRHSIFKSYRKKAGCRKRNWVKTKEHIQGSGRTQTGAGKG